MVLRKISITVHEYGNNSGSSFVMDSFVELPEEVIE